MTVAMVHRKPRISVSVYKPTSKAAIWCNVGTFKGWEIRLDSKLRLSVWAVELTTVHDADEVWPKPVWVTKRVSWASAPMHVQEVREVQASILARVKDLQRGES